MKSKNKLNSIKNWLRVGVKKILNTLAAGYIRTVLGHNSKVSLELGIGDLSYNSDEKILVSLTEEEAENLPKEDLMKILKFKTYHEVSHFLFTDDEEYREGMKIILEEFQKEADGRGLLLIKQVVNQTHDLMNSVEDGRIENILCRIYPGAKKHRDWYRLSEWKEGAVQEKAQEIIDLRNVVLTISTLGILTNGYEAKYPQGTVMFETAMKLAAPISDFVQAGEIKDGYEAIRKIAKIVAPWYVGTFGITEEEYKRLASSEKYSQQDLRRLAEEIAEQERGNNKGQAKKEGKPSGNGPVVSVLKDDDPPAENGEENTGEGEKPDLIVDLRKNPPKMDNSEEDDDKDAPMYYRPEDLEQPESNKDSGSEGNSSSQGKASEDKSSENSDGDRTSKGTSNSFDEENDPAGGSGCPDSKDSDDSSKEDSSSKENKSSQKSSVKKSSEGKSNDKKDVSETSGEKSEDSKEDVSGESKESKSGDSKNSAMESEENSKKSEDSEDSKENSKENSKESSDSKDSKKEGTSEYHLPSPEDFTSRVDETLGEIEEEAEIEDSRDVERANRDTSSWERSSIVENDGLPLSQEKITCLAKEFGGGSITVQDFRTNPHSEKAPADLVAKGKRLAKKIDTIFNRKSVKDKRDVKYGLVDSQNLGKFITGQQDFYRQDGRKISPDIACLILKDDSGSMQGKNENSAMEVLAELEETFKELKFPLRMQAFSTMGHENSKIIKSWNDTDRSKNYSWTFHRSSYPDGGNNDAYSIALATDVLAQRKEKNKLLIVVSDGAPCCSTELVKKAVCRAQTMGIFVISILIGTERDVNANWNTFVSMYGKNLLSGSLDNLGNQMFKFLKKFADSIK